MNPMSMTIEEIKKLLQEGEKFDYTTPYICKYQLKLRSDGVGYLVLQDTHPLPNHIAFLLKDKLHIVIYSAAISTIQDVPYSIIKFY
jgi:hypothetical protein